jgi:phospholipid transport system substrate-binding protein
MVAPIRLIAASAVVATVLTLLASSVRAADGGVDFVRTRQFLVTALLRLRPNEQRDRQVSAVLERMFAYDKMAERTLPDHWSRLSEGQHAEYTSILKRLIQRNYEKKMEGVVDHRVELTSENLDLDEVMVHARFTSGRTRRPEDEIPVAIDYQLSPSGSSFKVVDIVAGGSSFVEQYKSKFQPVIEKEGFEAFLTHLKDSLGSTSQP